MTSGGNNFSYVPTYQILSRLNNIKCTVTVSEFVTLLKAASRRKIATDKKVGVKSMERPGLKKWGSILGALQKFTPMPSWLEILSWKSIGAKKSTLSRFDTNLSHATEDS